MGLSCGLTVFLWGSLRVSGWIQIEISCSSLVVSWRKLFCPVRIGFLFDVIFFVGSGFCLRLSSNKFSFSSRVACWRKLFSHVVVGSQVGFKWICHVHDQLCLGGNYFAVLVLGCFLMKPFFVGFRLNSSKLFRFGLGTKRYLGKQLVIF